MFDFGQNNGNGLGITKAHVIGAAVGIGVTVAGFYLYKKNKTKVDTFLRNQGINIKSCDSTNYEDMSIEALTEVKEHIEDILAEKELNTGNIEPCETSCKAE
ncbi:MAG: hypothetical protein ACLTQH_03300 [Fusobacterium sp.]